MRQRIKLHSHDRSKNYLTFGTFRDGLYEFTLKSELPYVRVSVEKDAIVMVDPPGGPAMRVGDESLIPGMKLEKIGFVKNVGHILYFKAIRYDSSSGE